MESRLKKLEELTAKLPVLGEGIQMNETIYKLEGGVAKSVSLLAKDTVNVAHTVCEAGVKWQRHNHEGRESLGVVRGKGIFYMNGNDPVEITVGDIFIIDPGVPHWMDCETEMELVAFVIPSDPGYPTNE